MILDSPENAYLHPLQAASDVRATPRGIDVTCGEEVLAVDFVRDDICRLRVSRGGLLDDGPRFALAHVDAPAVSLSVTSSHGVVRVSSPVMSVEVTLDPLRVDVRRGDGSSVAESYVDASGRSWGYASLNDRFVVRRRCGPGDAFYGLGEKTGPGNRRGQSYTMWNTDVLDPNAAGAFTASLDPEDPRADRTGTHFDPYYVSIPLLHHLDSTTGAVAASFVENTHRAEYDLAEPDSYAFGFDGGQYTEYLFPGPDLASILEGYTWLTGRAPLPPLWALGYQQCRWDHVTDASTRAVAAELRARDIPCDGLWLDIEHMDGYRVFTWNRDHFPDPEGMIRDLARDGFRVVTIVDPGIKREPGCALYDDARDRGVLCRTASGEIYSGQVWPGVTAFPDFVTPEARDWWADRNAEHARTGVAGIWNDMNEPATGEVSPDAMRFGAGEFPHERFHNQYALLMAMATAQGLLKARPEERPFILSRAGSPGIQRYAANWMGDNMSRWDHLAMSMPMAAGFGLSGQPLLGADVGGFGDDCSAELLVRWTQYGALTPFFRNHSMVGTREQYPWSFGDEVAGLVRDAVAMRYRLLPYLYAAFVEARDSGLPVQRPLLLADQEDPVLRDLDDEYLLGRDLLIAPVTGPGVVRRPVYLPRGEWFDWHTDARVDGGQWVQAEAPLDRIPLYVRSGAVIPVWPTAPASVSEHRPETIELHVFVPGHDGTWTSLLQEDDGVTLAEESGARLRTDLTLTRSGGLLTLTGDVRGDGFPGFRRSHLRAVLHGGEVAHATFDGSPMAVLDATVTLANKGSGFALTIRLG